jgi:hypothetical protein
MYEWQHVVLQLGHFVSQSDLQHSLAQSPAYEDPISAKIKITGAHVLIPIAEYICCVACVEDAPGVSWARSE